MGFMGLGFMDFMDFFWILWDFVCFRVHGFDRLEAVGLLPYLADSRCAGPPSPQCYPQRQKWQSRVLGSYGFAGFYGCYGCANDVNISSELGVVNGIRIIPLQCSSCNESRLISTHTTIWTTKSHLKTPRNILKTTCFLLT